MKDENVKHVAAIAEPGKRGSQWITVDSEVGVGFVLQYGDVVALSHLQQRAPPLQRQRESQRILVHRNQPDELGASSSVFERDDGLLQGIWEHAVIVAGHVDRFGSALQHHAETPHVGEFLDQHRVARIDERFEQDGDGPAGAVGYEHVVGRRVEAAVGGQTLSDQFAEPHVPARGRIRGQRVGTT